MTAIVILGNEAVTSGSLCGEALGPHQQGDQGDHLSQGDPGWTPQTHDLRGHMVRSRDRANTGAWIFASRLLDSALCFQRVQAFLHFCRRLHSAQQLSKRGSTSWSSLRGTEEMIKKKKKTHEDSGAH